MYFIPSPDTVQYLAFEVCETAIDFIVLGNTGVLPGYPLLDFPDIFLYRIHFHIYTFQEHQDTENEQWCSQLNQRQQFQTVTSSVSLISHISLDTLHVHGIIFLCIQRSR